MSPGTVEAALGGRWALVDDVGRPLPAAGQMEADAGSARAAAAGVPSLRLYTWARPALSLGRFQPEGDVDEAACAEAGVEVVRRPTGGRALLHGGDLTYAVALPRPPGWTATVDDLYCLLARGLVAGLARLGVEAEVARHDGEAGAACFAAVRGSDLRVGDRKLCGSAQVRWRRMDGLEAGAVLQHGSVLLDRLAFDETDLLRYADPEARRRERERLRAATVTMGELGAPTDARVVADALVAGFRDALDLDLRPTLHLDLQRRSSVPGAAPSRAPSAASP